MSQIKGHLFGWFIFSMFIIPMLLAAGIDSINSHGLTKVSTELADVVKSEGGITPKVSNIVSNLSRRGYTITFTNDDGVQVSGRQSFGDEIVMNTTYKYQSVLKERTLHTQNTIEILRR